MNNDSVLWTAQEEQYLRDNFSQKTYYQIASDLNRTYRHVHEKAREMGLRKRSSYTVLPWTPKEVKYLLDHWYLESTEQLMGKLNRKKSEIKNKAKKLGLRKTHQEFIGLNLWSDRDDRYLKDNWLTQTAAQIGQVLGRSTVAIANRAAEKGYQKRPPFKEWSTQDDVYLKANWPAKTVKAIARALNRNVSYIQAKILDHRLKTKTTSDESKQTGRWTETEDNYLQEHYGQQSKLAIAQHLNRPVNSVTHRASRLRLLKTPQQQMTIRASAQAITDAVVLDRISHDQELRPFLMEHPELLELKRRTILLTNKLNRP